MAQELLYRLDDPGYTIYHRAALGGLAASIRAWGNAAPIGIKAELERLQVRLWWDRLTDHSALERILQASFKLTSDKIIDLPGQFIPPSETELKKGQIQGVAKGAVTDQAKFMTQIFGVAA
jgi:hypothetical protein